MPTPDDFVEEIVWPYAPLPDDRSEEYEWATDVLSGKTTEQRISQREYPAYSMQYAADLYPNQVGAAEVLAESVFASNNRLLLPVWSERVIVAGGSLGTGSITSVAGDFSNSFYEAGGRAILWISPNEYYVYSMAVQQNNSLTFESGGPSLPDLTGKTVCVMPLLSGWAEDGISIDHTNGLYHRVKFSFRTDVDRTFSRNLRLYFALERSGSMVNELETEKEAARRILADVWSIVQQGYVSVSVCFFFWTFVSIIGTVKRITKENITTYAEIQEILDYIDTVSTSASAVIVPVAEHSATFFSTTVPATNLMFIISDAGFNDHVAALSLFSDMLDKSGGGYNQADGTAVNMVSAVLGNPAGTATAKMQQFDNTTDGTVLNIGEFDVEALYGLFSYHLDGAIFGYGYVPSIYTSYEDGLILLRKNIEVDGISRKISRARTAFVTKSGPYWFTDDKLYNSNDYMVTMNITSKAELSSLLKFLFIVRGKLRPFYMPSQNADFVMTEDQIVNTQINVRRGGMDNPARYIGRTVQIEDRNGVMVYRTITAAALSTSTTIQLTFNAALPRLLKVRDVMGIHFLTKYRLDTDAVTINHLNVQQSRISFAITRLPS